MSKLRLVYDSPNDLNPELADGDVYITRNTHGIFLQEYATPDKTAPSMWRVSSDPTLRLSPVYVGRSGWLHKILSEFDADFLKSIVMEMVDVQNMYAPLRVPKRGTWCYTLSTRKDFSPNSTMQVKRLVLSKNDAQIKQHILKHLVNPICRNFVVVLPCLEINNAQIALTSSKVKALFGKWKIYPNVDIWDKHIFSTLIYHYSGIMVKVVEEWIKRG